MTALPLPPLLVLVAALGLAVGSFLNVVVHRVPTGASVLHPPSACPACGHGVRPRDNVPVVSWLLLRGRCRDCASPIPWRYPAVEAGTAVLAVGVSVVVARHAGSARADGEPLPGAGVPLLVACLVVACAGVALALVDLAHQRLPFAITGWAAALAGAALVVGWALAGVADGPGAAAGVAAPALGGAALWLAVYGGTWLVTAGRGMGLGDVALAPLLGLVLGAAGTAEAAVGLAAGFVLGAVVGAALLGAARVGAGAAAPAPVIPTVTPTGSVPAAAAVGSVAGGRGLRIPFGPFMLVGAGAGLVVGEPVAAAYLSLVGLA